MLRQFTFLLVSFVLLASCQSNPVQSNASLSLNESFAQAVGANDVQRAQALIEQGADVNGRSATGTSMLMLASFRGSLASMQLLLQAGADPGLLDDEQQSALHYAAQSPHPDTVATLLQARPSLPIDQKQKNDLTALMLATRHGHEKNIEALLEKGANPNITTQEGWTAIYFAVTRGRPRILELLIKHGAKLNVQDEDGQTPLHVAVEYRQLPVCEFLLKNKVEKKTKDNEGFTALQLAQQAGFACPSQ